MQCTGYWLGIMRLSQTFEDEFQETDMEQAVPLLAESGDA